MEIEVRSWEKFNPKRDQKTYTWLRLDNDIVRGPEFYGLKNLEKYVAILILCEASKAGKGTFWLDIEWFADEVVKEDLEFVLATIDKLSIPNKRGESFIIIHSKHEDPNQITFLASGAAHDNSLQSTTPDYTGLPPALQSTTPTNERTDVTNGRTDGRFLNIENVNSEDMDAQAISQQLSSIRKSLESDRETA